jgi:hypothetical protein
MINLKPTSRNRAPSMKLHLPVTATALLALVLSAAAEDTKRSPFHASVPIAANSQTGMDLVPMTRSRPPQPPGAEVVAAAFGYPDSTRLSKIEQERKPERASTLIWSRTYESGDYSFATTSIELLSAGGYLTPERRKELASEAAKMREEDAKMRSGDAKMRQESAAGMAASLTHEFELSGGRKGFAQLAGFGPGGTEYMAVALSPDGKYELVLRVSWSHEGGDKFRTTDNTKDYAKKLQREHAASAAAGHDRGPRLRAATGPLHRHLDPGFSVALRRDKGDDAQRGCGAEEERVAASVRR